MNIASTANRLTLRSNPPGQVQAQVQLSEYQAPSVEVSIDPEIDSRFSRELAKKDGQSLAEVREWVQNRKSGYRKKAVGSAMVGAASFAAAAGTLLLPQVPGVAMLGLSGLGVLGMVQAERFNQMGEQMATLDLLIDNAHRPHQTALMLNYSSSPTSDIGFLRKEYL